MYKPYIPDLKGRVLRPVLISTVSRLRKSVSR